MTKPIHESTERDLLERIIDMLDNLTAALTQLDVDVTNETNDAAAAFAALEAEIAGLKAGTITQAQIDALTAQAGAASAALQAADAAAKAATPAP